MKTAYFDQNFHLDDPNLYFGDPSYLLESGDADYVDPFPTNNQPIRRRKHMKHNRFYPDPQPRQIIWLRTFSGKLSDNATALSLATGVIQ